MKTILLVALLSCSLSNTTLLSNYNKKDLYETFSSSNVEKFIGTPLLNLFRDEKSLTLSKIIPITTLNDEGYILKYTNENNIIAATIVLESFGNTYKLLSTNSSDIDLPEKKINDKYYYLSPFDITTDKKAFDEASNITNYNMSKKVKSLAYDTPADRYFNFKNSNGNLNDFLYIYGGSTVSEVKIKNVPNYMNTQYSNNGCVPTSAAMYFAFLGRNDTYTHAGNLTKYYKGLPINHNDNVNLVNNFINYLGDNYFHTNNDGSSEWNITRGFNKYLSDYGFGNYKVHETSKYQDYAGAIYKSANPVQITVKPNSSAKNLHSILGIGYREIYNYGLTDRFIIANYVYNDIIEERTFRYDKTSFPQVIVFRPIYR